MPSESTIMESTFKTLPAGPRILYSRLFSKGEMVTEPVTWAEPLTDVPSAGPVMVMARSSLDGVSEVKRVRTSLSPIKRNVSTTANVGQQSGSSKLWIMASTTIRPPMTSMPLSAARSSR